MPCYCELCCSKRRYNHEDESSTNWKDEFCKLRKQWSDHSKCGDRFQHCDCCRPKSKTKAVGKFGVAWIVETPGNKNEDPRGWQIEIRDTPSGIERRCEEMIQWVNSPPPSRYDSTSRSGSSRKKNRRSCCHSARQKHRCRCGSEAETGDRHCCCCEFDTEPTESADVDIIPQKDYCCRGNTRDKRDCRCKMYSSKELQVDTLVNPTNDDKYITEEENEVSKEEINKPGNKLKRLARSRNNSRAKED